MITLLLVLCIPFSTAAFAEENEIVNGADEIFFSSATTNPNTSTEFSTERYWDGTQWQTGLLVEISSTGEGEYFQGAIELIPNVDVTNFSIEYEITEYNSIGWYALHVMRPDAMSTTVSSGSGMRFCTWGTEESLLPADGKYSTHHNDPNNPGKFAVAMKNDTTALGNHRITMTANDQDEFICDIDNMNLSDVDLYTQREATGSNDLATMYPLEIRPSQYAEGHGKLAIEVFGLTGGSFKCLIKNLPLEKVDPEGVEFTEGNERYVILGKSIKLNVRLLPETATDPTISYVSANPSIAEVSTTGYVSAKAIGTTTITASTANGKTAELVIHVVSKPQSVSLEQDSLAMKVGESTVLKASLTPQDGAYPEVWFESSDETVVTVNQITGEITAVGPGTATITAKSAIYFPIQDTMTVTVEAPEEPSGGCNSSCVATAVVAVPLIGCAVLAGWLRRDKNR